MSTLPKKTIVWHRQKIEKILGNNTFDVNQLNEQDHILYGTFGYHDNEPPCSIMARKVKELQDNAGGFGLWGTTIHSKHIGKVRKFCEDISQRGKEVYVFLKFTGSTAQKNENRETDPQNCPAYTKIENAGDNHCCNQNRCPIWTIEELAKDKDHYFTSFQDGDHNIIYTLNLEEALTSDKMPVPVRGKDNQNAAFVVEKYYFYVSKFIRKTLLQCYEGKLYSSDEKKTAEKLCTISPCYLLEKKENVELTEQKYANDTNWAIILKLKAPYIVEGIR